MTITTHVTSTSSTVMRAFTGMLEVGEETVPATVLFSDGSVSLVVVEDQVGIWSTSEVEFVPDADGYDIRAEGDSIRFLPDQGTDFSRFLRAPADDPGGPPDAGDPGDPVEPVDSGERSLSRVASPAEPVNGDSTNPTGGWEPIADRETLPPLGLDEEPAGSLAADPNDIDGPEPEEGEVAGISVEAPDEYYAAGLTGPAAETSPPAFKSPIASTPASPEPQSGGDTPEAPKEFSPPEDRVRDITHEPSGRAEARPGANGVAVGSEATEAPPTSDVAPPATLEPPSEETIEEAASPDAAPAAETDKPLTRLLKRARAMSEKEAETQPVERDTREESDDDLRRPIADSQNMKQWALVVAGGVVLLVIIGVVGWGLISLLGGDDPADLAAATDPVPTTVTAPTPTAPPATAPAPSTTVPGDNLAAAQAFVTSWNDIARDYAYHLNITADVLPISTAPAPTVHLTYGEDGVLLLTMAPKGTGSDRDILMAMGLAVAWADPSLSPGERKELLGALGVDVDDPKVSDMGGDLVRNGVNYATTVSEGVIRFQVDRQT